MNIIPEKFKFRLKLTIIFVVLAVLPLVFAMGFAIFRMRSVQIDNAVRVQQKISDSAVAEFSDFVSHQFTFLDEVSRIYSSPEINSGVAERLLDRILFSNKNLLDISVAGSGGNEIARKHRFRLVQPSEFRNIADEETFLIAQSRKNYIGPIVFENGKPQFVIARATFDSLKQFSGAVVATIDARAMQEVVDSILSVQDGGRAYVVDRNGIVVAHPDISNVLARRDFSFVPIVSEIKGTSDGFNPRSSYTDELGRKVLGAFTKVDVELGGIVTETVGTRWFIVAEEPASVALFAVNTITLAAFIILLVVLVGAFFAAIIFARQVVSPIEILHKTMVNFGKGDLRARATVKTGDEIEDLAGGFNKMAVDLATAVRNLKKDKEVISAERNKLAVILSGITDAVVALDDRFKIVSFNTAAEKLSGQKSENVLGKKASNIFKLYDNSKEVASEKYCPSFGDGFEGVSFEKKSVRLFGAQDKESFVDVSTGHISEAKQAGIRCLLVFHDTTKEMMVEKVKKEFVSLAAHQMRTPLSGIRWLINVLSAEDAGRLNAKQKKLLERGSVNVELMMKMIDELLDTARMEEGRYSYKPEKARVEPILKETFDFYESKISEKKLSLDFKAEKNLPPVFIDPPSFRTAFMNVFENAVLYTKLGGKIEVSAGVSEGKVVIFVKDSGIGIPEAEKKSIFEKFFRGKEAVSMETEGNGIGLYMAKNILKSQGGGIRLESKEGEGTEVFISLPIFKQGLALVEKKVKIKK